LLAGLASAVVIRRFGSARVAVVGTVLTGLGALSAGVAPSAVVFMVGLFFTGSMGAITDVALYAHGMSVHRRHGRSLMNSFHAVWSVGAILGGSMSAGAIALGLPVDAHLGLSAAIFSTVSLISLRSCLSGQEELTKNVATTHAGRRSTPPRARVGSWTMIMVAALALIAIAGTSVEDAGNSWAGVYLSDSLQAPAALAATGYIALVGGQFLGRVFGDRLVDHFGQRAVARVGGVITLGGMAPALVFPTVRGTILGFGLAGRGGARLVPAAWMAAARLPGLRPGPGRAAGVGVSHGPGNDPGFWARRSGGGHTRTRRVERGRRAARSTSRNRADRRLLALASGFSALPAPCRVHRRRHGTSFRPVGRPGH